MEFPLVLFRLLTALLSVYMILLSLRIILTWFQVPQQGDATRLLGKITDPYLRLFRSLKFLRTSQGLDFSPLAAFLVLNLVLQVFASLQYGTTLGSLVILPLELIWSTVAFFLGLVLLAALIRLVTLVTGWGGRHLVLQTLDRLIQPAVVRVSRRFTRRMVTYRTGLLMLMALTFLASVAGGLTLHLLRILFRSLLG